MVKVTVKPETTALVVSTTVARRTVDTVPFAVRLLLPVNSSIDSTRWVPVPVPVPVPVVLVEVSPVPPPQAVNKSAVKTRNTSLDRTRPIITSFLRLKKTGLTS